MPKRVRSRQNMEPVPTHEMWQKSLPEGCRLAKVRPQESIRIVSLILLKFALTERHLARYCGEVLLSRAPNSLRGEDIFFEGCGWLATDGLNLRKTGFGHHRRIL